MAIQTASEFDLPYVGSVSVGGAPEEFKDAPALPMPKVESEFDLPLVGEAPSEFDLPLVGEPPQTPFKYQQDPEIQRIAGTPEERKEVGTIGNVEAKEIPFKDLYTKPDNLKVIRDYAEARFGAAGKQKKNESDEDYTKRWMTSMRQVEWNTSLNAIPELNWLSNAKQDDVIKAARAHNLYNSVPSFFTEGGQPGIRPIAEGVFSAVTDPANLLGFGAGAATRYAIARGAIQNVLSSKLKAFGGVAALEASLGVGQSAIDQQIARETGTQRDQADMLQYGISAAFGVLAGGAEVASTMGKKIPPSKERFEQMIAGKKVPVKEDEQLAKLKELFSKNQEELEKQSDIFEGRKVLDALSSPTELTEAAVRSDIHKKAMEVAMYVMYLAPEFRPKEGQQISRAVNDIVANLDSLDENIFDNALSRANITAVDFANAIQTTTSDAGKLLNSYSQISKVLKKLGSVDPAAQKQLDDILAADEKIVTPIGNFLNGIRRLERESKALVVSGIGTTARNVLGTGIGLTYEAGAKLVENSLYAGGRAMKAIVGGDMSLEGTGRGLVNVVRDSFATLGYLSDAGLTAETVDALLKRNPSLQKQIFTALQETGTDDLSRVAKLANTLNMAQDTFFRRAIFASSVDRQLKRIGLNMDEVLANDTVIPVDILKTATEETLKATFSYVPKVQKGTKQTVEAKAETLASKAISFIEDIPGGSLAVTFPRFMANAMAFQYRYSPLGATSGASEMAQGARLIAKGDEAAGQALIEKGMTKMSRGVAGTAAIYAMYKYRLDNQDSEWYNVTGDDGSTVDIRGVFPLGPHMAVADFSAKLKLGKFEDAKLTEVAEAIVGMKMPAGSQASLLDELPNLIAGAEGKAQERVSIALGRLFGDFAGRFVTPLKAPFEYLDLFDKEGQIARDPNVIDTMKKDSGFLTTAGQAAVQRVMAKIPELKEDLPGFQPYFSDKAPVRAGEFFNSLTGIRNVPQKGGIEREFVKLKLDPYTFFGATGDKVYDRAFIKTALPYVENRITGLINSERYQGFTRDQQRIAMATNLQETLSMAREMTQAKMTASDRDRVNKMRFNKLPAVARRAINELYAEQNDGKTMDETKEYSQVYKYEALIQRYR
jgi:hypothetical protein